MNTKKLRINNNNDSTGDMYGKLQNRKTYTNEIRPLSASSIQREAESTFVERRSTIDDVTRKEVPISMGIDGGGNTRPRPLSASSLVSHQLSDIVCSNN